MSTSNTTRNPLVRLCKQFAKSHRRKFGLGLSLLVPALLLQRLPALIIGVALDGILLNSSPYEIPLIPKNWLPQSTGEQALLTLGILGGAVVAESLLKWYGQLAYTKAMLETVHDIRTNVYAEAVSLPIEFYEGSSSGDILSKLNDDVNNVGDLFTGIRDGILYLGALIAAFTFLALLNWNLALLLLIIPFLLAGTSRVYANLIESRYDSVRAEIGNINVRLQESLKGIDTIKSYTNEQTEINRLSESSKGYQSSAWGVIKLRALYNGGTYIIGSFGIWALFLVGGYWIISGPPLFFSQTLSPGSLLTFLIYAQSFLDPTRRLAVDVIDKIQNAQASSKRIQDLLDERAEMEAEKEDGYYTDMTRGDVTYEDVSFTYPSAETEAVTDVSFSVDEGDFVGLVGGTGAGKSTLMKLLLRFHDPDEGTIRIDGRNIADIEKRTLRDHIGYVSQDPFLFRGTLAENIAYATSDFEREDVVEAARRAGADEFVSSMDEGYETTISDGGTTLSGGEKQRIAIARALFKGCDILIFDEATSHVDNETEAEIRDRLKSIAGTHTVFVIAHRLSTVRETDRILVMDDGELVEEGTHEELVNDDGIYAKFWDIQVGEGVTPATASAESGDRV